MTSNISPKILELTQRKLLLKPHHPLSILKQKIYEFFHRNYPNTFTTEDNFDPKVPVKNNFDLLLIPENHPSRSLSDTYYFDPDTVLRTHTTAHDFYMLSKYNAFLLAGDVYRRDEIDAKHYPAFHQLEGGRVWKLSELGLSTYEQGTKYAVEELKTTLESLAKEVFGNVEMRWNEEYFPFTDPSLELEIRWMDDWLEILGCGAYKKQVLLNAGRDEETFGWAFGLGLERWAMKVFEIPDIRLFWTQDERFTTQFSAEKGFSKFTPYSKYPVCYKDISFWVPEFFAENDFFEVVRNVGGDLVEKVDKIDCFTKNGRTSYCYRINYRSMDRSLTNEEIDQLQFQLRDLLPKQLSVELR